MMKSQGQMRTKTTTTLLKMKEKEMTKEMMKEKKGFMTKKMVSKWPCLRTMYVVKRTAKESRQNSMVWK